MTQTDILSNLSDLISCDYKLDVSTISMDSGLADLGLDSLALAELMFSIEDRMGVNMESVAAADMPATVGELVQLIERSSQQKNSPPPLPLAA